MFLDPVAGYQPGVVTGAAGHDLDRGNIGKHFVGRDPKSLFVDPLGTDTPAQGIGDCARLLVDLLQHEMAEMAPVGVIGHITQLFNRALHIAARGIGDPHAERGHIHDIAFLEEDHAVGDLAQGHLIGGDEMLADTDADHQRAALARCNQTVRLVARDHRDRKRTFEFGNGCFHGVQQREPAGTQAVDQVNDHLGVGLGNEPVPGLAQAFAQPLVVFDDAVVHQRQAVCAQLWVGIHFAWTPMGCPASMGNTGHAEQRFGL